MSALNKQNPAERGGINHYIEYGGGLGDVFNQMFHRGSYNVLRDLSADERARLVIISHNRFVSELFDYHPNRERFTVESLGYWHTKEENDINRKVHNMPQPGANWNLPEKDTNIVFHCSERERADVDNVARIYGDYVVMAASAGEPDRTLPGNIFADIVYRVSQKYPIIMTGRTYARNGRSEIRCGDGDETRTNLFDYVDSFTVPGVASLLHGAAGLITCHSSLNILGWHLNKPQLLLYPEATYNRHIVNRDQWAFGVDRASTVHSQFQHYTPELTNHFLQIL